MMNAEITLSLMPVVSIERMRSILDRFEDAKRIKVNLQMIEWANYRARLVDMAVHGRGADVSTVSLPITSDLIGMNVLRPYRANEIQELGGPASFLGSSWKSGIQAGDERVWAIPWMIDSRFIFYWQDVLEKAGIDSAAAFSSTHQIAETFRTLQVGGFTIPFVAPNEANLVQHAVSSWIWEAGADVFSQDGTEVTFHAPAALDAITAYFEMVRQLPPETFDSNSQNLFPAKRAVFALAGRWFIVDRQDDQVGCTGVPGGSYIGGTNLVVWKHTHNAAAAVELVKWLSQVETQKEVAFNHGVMPSRTSFLDDTVWQTDPVWGPQIRAVKNGRTYPCVPMIGLVEDRLSQELFRVQRELFVHPERATGEIVRSIIEPLGRRLNLALSSSKSSS